MAHAPGHQAQVVLCRLGVLRRLVHTLVLRRPGLVHVPPGLVLVHTLVLLLGAGVPQEQRNLRLYVPLVLHRIQPVLFDLAFPVGRMYTSPVERTR